MHAYFKAGKYFEQIINQEKNLSKQRLLRVLSGPLNIDSVIIPEIQHRLDHSAPKIILLTGIGAIFSDHPFTHNSE